MNGFLLFRSPWDGQDVRIPIRACPDPAAIRASFEEILGAPVRWERAR